MNKNEKLKSVENTLQQILIKINDHLDLPDDRIKRLSDYELILGVTQIMFEDSILKDENKVIEMAMEQKALNEFMKDSTKGKVH